MLLKSQQPEFLPASWSSILPGFVSKNRIDILGAPHGRGGPRLPTNDWHPWRTVQLAPHSPTSTATAASPVAHVVGREGMQI